MKIFNFCKDEETFLIDNCNFTEEELKVFRYKQKGWSIVQIAMALPTSERTVNAIVDRIVNKIIRTLIIRAIKNKSN